MYLQFCESRILQREVRECKCWYTNDNSYVRIALHDEFLSVRLGAACKVTKLLTSIL